MRRKIAFHQYNLYEQHHYGLLLKSLNDARFSYTHKALPHAAKPKTGDCPYYLKSTIDYIKYLVTEMECDQPSQVEPSWPIVSTQVFSQQIGF